MGGNTLGSLAVVEAEAYVPLESPRPGVEPVALAADERVERIEKKRSHAFERYAFLRAFSCQPVEDGNHEALRLARARATADDGGGGLFGAERLPGRKLMRVGPAGERKLVVLPPLFGRTAQAADKTLIQQLAFKLGHADVRLLPAESGFKGGVAREAPFFTRCTGKHGVQTAAQGVVVQGQSGGHILPYAVLKTGKKPGKVRQRHDHDSLMLKYSAMQQ